MRCRVSSTLGNAVEMKAETSSPLQAELFERLILVGAENDGAREDISPERGPLAPSLG